MTDHATLRTLAEAATPGRHEVPYVDANRRDVLTEHDLFRGEPTDALVARARQHIADLCTKRASWRMAIPPSNHDSDMLLGEALTRLSDELETLRAALGDIATMLPGSVPLPMTEEQYLRAMLHEVVRKATAALAGSGR